MKSRAGFRRRWSAQLLAVGDEDFAGGRPIDAGEDVEHGGFSGAVGADEADKLAGEQFEVEIIDRLEAAELHGHVPHHQQRGGILGVLILGGEGGGAGGDFGGD